MSTLILNLTGNRDGFENKLSEDLQCLVRSAPELRTLRGDDLIGGIDIPDDCHVIVIFAHAGSTDAKSVVETGLNAPVQTVDEMLQSPTVLVQLLKPAASEHIIVFCACSACSPETGTCTMERDSCLGVVASWEGIGRPHIQDVAAVIDELHTRIRNRQTQLQDLHQAVATNRGTVAFQFVQQPQVKDYP